MQQNRVRQMVILAGGYGTRLSPITDVLPKPLIRVGDKSFLEHLIDNGIRLGFTKFTILAGHLGELIEKFLLEQKYPDFQIQVLITPPEYSSKDRLIAAMHSIENLFCLTYGDNLVQFLPEEEVFYFDSNDTAARCVGYKGSGYHRNRNLWVDPENNLLEYKRITDADIDKGLLNLGWYILNTGHLEKLRSYPGELEESIFSLKHDSKFKVQTVIQKYYSVGEANRLAASSRFLDKNRRVLLLDRDGTINEKAEIAEYILSWSHFRWRGNAKLSLSKKEYLRLERFVITNQPAVGRGLVSKNEIDQLHQEMLIDLFAGGGTIDAFMVCYHGWHDSCNCRKPNIGLFISLQHLFDLNWAKCVYIGDDERDQEAAHRLGIEFINASPIEFNLENSIDEWLARKA